MKIKKILPFTIKTAALAFVLCVLTWVFIPQGNDKMDDITSMPVFEDLTYENRMYIETVYMNGIMTASGGGCFGTDKPLTASEAAYISVWLYEWKNKIEHSFHEFEAESEAYIEKAVEYGAWPQLDKSGGESLTRQEFGAVLSLHDFGGDDENIGEVTEFNGMENYKFSGMIMQLYNKGIALNPRLTDAYSNEKIITRGESAQLITRLLSPVARLTELSPDYSALKKQLEDMMSGYDGEWSLYFEDYESQERIIINSHQTYSASLIKLFVMQTVYSRIAEGKLSDSDRIEKLLTKMITYSDNDAWSDLARILGGGSYSGGMKLVTETAKNAGFTESGHFIKGNKKNYNFTSVTDCGNYMRKVLDGQLVSPEYSEKILNLLKQQQLCHKIPAGVPDGVQTANKTGELEYMQGDAAIVYAPSGTYILAVIADSLNNVGVAQEQIRQLSKAVYEYLNP